jgi:hypothetical protein
MEEKIMKEIDYLTKKERELLNLLKIEKLDLSNKEDKELFMQRYIALGEIMALQDLKYSIKYNNWLFEKSKEGK